MNDTATMLIVGSGPAGAQAARQAIDEGLSVVLLDYGNDDEGLASLIPDEPFSVIRSNDPNQREYLIGDEDLVNVDEIRVGAHLTPPRQFITRDVQRLLPFESTTFQAMQSLALGGLAAGWGAGAYTFEERELLEAGLSPERIRSYYDALARDIGISGAPDDDNAPFALEMGAVQPPLAIDANAATILRTYGAKRERLRREGFVLGRAPVAALSEAVDDPTRSTNPYFDMDFYGESRRSVYRPKYTIEQLRRHPRFRYVSGALVKRFKEDEQGVAVFYAPRGSQPLEEIRGDALLLAANAINSARITLESLNLHGVRTPLLSNPYHYIPCVNLAMFGRRAEDRRHSLAQLFGIYSPPHRQWERVTAAFYSYRALLLYKLVKEMPLPVNLGLLAARTLMTSFTIVGVHHPDRHTARKWLQLRGDGVLTAHYELDDAERGLVSSDIAGVRRALRMLGCIPLSVIDPGYGSSIHYAGTLPSNVPHAAAATEPTGRIRGTRAVYAADSSGWNYLPAKGLTLTIMANARRVASEACSAVRAAATA